MIFTKLFCSIKYFIPIIVFNIINKKIHNKKYKEDWYYRLLYNSKSIKDSYINITKYDQYLSKIIIIFEMNDIPREIWIELLNKEYNKFKKYAIIYSCGNNKDKIIKYIIDYYILKYSDYNNINNAREKILNILKLEFFD
jgi:hypothetical protein